MTEHQRARFFSNATELKIADQIPADIRSVLTPAQNARLVTLMASLMAPPQAEHAITYRVSTSFLGHRIYLALFSGAERRVPKRVARQKRTPLYLLMNLVIGCLTLLAMVMAVLIWAAIVLYLVKSWLGIDIFDGPSFLHEYVFGG